MLAHVHAVRDQMLVPLGYRVYTTNVPEAPTYPYILLAFTPGEWGATFQGDNYGTLDTFLDTIVAGQTADQVLIVHRRIREALQGRSPSVPGRRVDALRQFHAEPVRVDRDVPLPSTGGFPYYALVRWRLSSNPLVAA